MLAGRPSRGKRRSTTPSYEELLAREAEIRREEEKLGLDTPQARAREANERVRRSQANPVPNGHASSKSAPSKAVHEGNGEPPKTEAMLLTAADIVEKPIKWLWESRIPYGMVSILDGDPDLGKSTITMDLAARLSRGWEMPPANSQDVIRAPGNVLVLNAEDAAASTIVPRLRLAGANMKRIKILTGIKRGEEECDVLLPFDLDVIRDTIVENLIRFVVVDPFMAYLDGSLDAHRDQDVRRCMRQLGKVAEETTAAFLVNRHLDKLMGGPALYRGGASIGIIGAARSGLIVGKHPQIPGTMVLARNKGNLAAPWRSLCYSLERVEGEQLARVGWGEETDLNAEDILAHPSAKRSKADQATDDIREILAAGPMPTEELDKRMKTHRHSANAIKHGRKEAGVKTYREGFGKDGKWMVHIPQEQDDDDGPDENPFA
jgi:hypothetical protein